MRDSFEGLSQRARQWDTYYSSEDPFTCARRTPGTWIVVYELRPLEFIASLVGLRFEPYWPTKVIRYDPSADRFRDMPFRRMPVEFQWVHRPRTSQFWQAFRDLLSRRPRQPTPHGSAAFFSQRVGHGPAPFF